MKKNDITSFRLKKLINDEDKYDFDDFLKTIRAVHGMNRRAVSNDIGINESRIFYLENGIFQRFPKEDITILAEYYGVPATLLRKKAKKLIEEHKNRPKGYKKREHVPMSDTIKTQNQKMIQYQ